MSRGPFTAASRGIVGLAGPPVQDELPYEEPFAPSHHCLIVKALIEGLRRLVSAGVFDPKTAKEPTITSELIEELNRMLHNENDEPLRGFSLDSFQAVTGSKLKNWNGVHLEKQPDIAFRPQRMYPGIRYPDQMVFLVECKLVTDEGLSLYGTEGMARFVRGDYAWAVSSGMMLGYARGGYALPNELGPYLRNARTDYEVVSGAAKHDTVPDVYVTIHSRNRVTCLPADERARIRLLHLWVDIA